MALTDTDYLRQLQALLPPGPAWPKNDDATLTRLFGALASELARVDGRAWQLLEEADPRTTAELFLDWERVAGLPDACAALRVLNLGPGIYGGIGISDLELFSRASTATYFGADGLLHTAAANAPRFNCNPVTHAQQGLLLEAAATNLVAYSEQANSVPWVLGSVTIVPNSAISPDGALTADAIYDTAVNSQHYITQSTTPVAAGAKIAISAYVKAGTLGVVYIEGCNGLTYPYCFFNVNTGAVGSAGNGAVGSIASIGNGWYRCCISFTMASLSAAQTIVGINTVEGFDYIGTGKFLYVWGVQTEVGTAATSYIPTAATTISRASDICSTYQPLTMQERSAALVSKLVTLGGQSPAYFIGLAAALGYAITITEFHAHTVCDDVNHPLYDLAWNFAWQVNGALATISQLSVTDPVGDPLASWGNVLLECVLTRLKPAHTIVLFNRT
jgi:uncharacterized protein YmfQ (DUF2313 family)